MGKGDSGEPSVDAVVSEELDGDPIAVEFFSSAPPPPAVSDVEGWQAEPMPRHQRRAMLATYGMLGMAALALVGFGPVADAALVQPEPVGSARMRAVADLRFESPPAAVAAPEPAVAPAPAPVAAPEPVPMVAPEPEPAPEPAAPVATPVSQPLAVPAASAKHSSQSRSLPARRAVPRERAARPRPAKPTTAAGLRKRAYRALNAGDARAALAHAQRALALDPTDAGIYIVLGGARDALGDAAGAKAAFRQCVARARGPLVSGCRTLAR